MVDYRLLLIKYMRHIKSEEGICYVYPKFEMTLFSDEELEVLKYIEESFSPMEPL